MRIGIFGGTFDPIHEGHLAVARAARDEFRLDNVLFIPAYIPPHKQSLDLTPSAYRYRMVEFAIRNEPAFEISDVEISRPGVSYTVDTLRGLHRTFPADEFFWILGADTLKDILTWREPMEVMKLTEFLVAPRKGFSAQTFSLPPACRAHWIRMREYPFSSSEIRSQIAERKPIGHLLPAGVEDYLRRMKLYGT